MSTAIIASGTKVEYHGSLTEYHGPATVLHRCICPPCEAEDRADRLTVQRGGRGPAPRPPRVADGGRTMSTWKRTEGGYMREDGAFFLSRGARMTHGANAWLIHQRVTEDRIGRDGSTAYDLYDGSPLWTIDADGYADTAPADSTDDLYAHQWDAGWLSEAKAVVTTVEQRQAADQ
jgi:hypothetical protein